jgi:hypothetical protein
MSCIPAVYTCCVVKKTIDIITCALYMSSGVCHVVTHEVCVYTHTHELQHVLNFATIKKKV